MTIEKMTEVPYPGLVPWLAVRKKINEIIEEGTGGEAAWGSITGTLADQSDLKDALDAKANTTDLPAEGELVPDTTGVSNGAVLTKVVSGTMWADPLPSTGSANAGDVLTLDSNKVAGWSTPAAGGEKAIQIQGLYSVSKTTGIISITVQWANYPEIDPNKHYRVRLDLAMTVPAYLANDSYPTTSIPTWDSTKLKWSIWYDKDHLEKSSSRDSAANVPQYTLTFEEIEGDSNIYVYGNIWTIPEPKYMICQATAPTGSDLHQGIFWYDTTNSKLKFYDGTQWNEVTLTPVV